MEIREQDPRAAFERLRDNPTALYLDVRTPEEFERGHPAGAWNVPVVFLEAGAPSPRPNPEFLEVVERCIPKDAELLVGCQSGVRSRRACEILARAGYRVTNVRGGFGGARDRGGRIVAEGWKDAGLPVEQGQPSGRCYRDLRAKTG